MAENLADARGRGVDQRLSVQITRRCDVRSMLSVGQVPALLIDYGGYELVLGVGPTLQDTADAKEFAIALAYQALNFAGDCKRRMSRLSVWPGGEAASPQSPAHREYVGKTRKEDIS